MATYAIGDIQGCYHAFQALLQRLEFDIRTDTLWLVGDLVNRGSGSLEVLRWCYQHQQNVKTVLGNHDLHALVVAHGIRSPHRGDTLQALIEAPDAEALFSWLRHQPLMVANDAYVMVHAGILPQWQLSEAMTYAKEVEEVLQGEDYLDFFSNMYGNTPTTWHDGLTGYDRLRVITNVMTRMRVCSEDGALDFNFKGELKDIPQGHIPWFDMPNRKLQEISILCGHWSALGLHQRKNIVALDTGCLWGGQLTAMCLETQGITQVPADKRDNVLKV